MTERKKILSGDQALAYGALSCGVRIVTGYPGSPSSGTVETLIGLAKTHNIYVEWSSNERVALEMGIGASIAGSRALVCTKSVGFNVMIDPLMALNLTPVHGGLVILLGDDPGGYGSQNDQDSRSLVASVEMPLMEPSTPSDAYAMMQKGFQISEQFNTPVIIRETRSFTRQVESFSVSDKTLKADNLGLKREPWRFVPVPLNVVDKHRNLHKTIDSLKEWAKTTAFNTVTGKGTKGIVGAGFAHQKVGDVLGKRNLDQFRLLKLGVLYPLPEKIIVDFLKECQDVLIVEENEPYIEIQIKAIAHDNFCRARIFGKQSSHISREGELFRWQIQDALAKFAPEFIPSQIYCAENEVKERPKRKDYCGNCQYDKILDALEAAAASLGQKPVIVGDPGCLVTVADRLDAKYAIGSAVAVADGLSKAGIEERAVAIFGDSAFFHSALPAICNAVHNRSKILMVILDNKATATSGFQTNPGVDKNALGQDAPSLDIEQIARACGVKHILSAGPDEHEVKLKDKFKEALLLPHLVLLIIGIRPK